MKKLIRYFTSTETGSRKIVHALTANGHVVVQVLIYKKISSSHIHTASLYEMSEHEENWLN